MEPDAHILWVHGNLETFKASYFKIHQEAGLAGDDEEARLQRVKRWLDSPESGNWVTVIDNFDDATDLTLNPYLPATRGIILFTMRDKRLIGPTVYVGARYGVEIQLMSDGEAIETLLQLLSGSRAVAESRTGLGKHAQLLLLLENFPLAIAQAAAYMNNMDMTVSEYLELLTCAQPKLLSKPLMIVGDNYKERTSGAVRTAWKITLEKIQSTSPTSVQLLELMSLFNPEDIPEDLFSRATFFENQCQIEFDKVLEPLIAFSLIYRLRTSSSFRLHPLVGLWVRTHIDSEDSTSQRKRKCLQMALRLVIDTIPKDPRDNLRKCSQLKPHAISVLTYSNGMSLELSILVVQRLGDITSTEGAYVEALEWYQRALEGKEKALGNDHPSTLSTVNNMASVFDNQGEYHKALKWYQRALDGMEKTLGNDHPDTLTAVHNMASVFDNQGKYHKALEWYQRALDGREKAVGNDHPDTLTTVHNMASVFDDQGKYIKALEWYQRALDGREKGLGNDHPYTLTTVHNMALVFDNQGEYTKALEWYQRALDGYVKALGNNHHFTLHTQSRIVALLERSRQGGVIYPQTSAD